MTFVRAARWVALSALAAVVVLTIAAAVVSRTERLRKLVVTTLADRLDSDVELDAFSVDTFPAGVIQGYGVRLRLHGQDSSIPPLIEIKSFTVHCGMLDLLRRPRRFRSVTLEGLIVNIPPGGLKRTGNVVADAVSDSADRASRSDPAAVEKDQAKVELARQGAASESPILIDELRANDALLRIIPRRVGKDPKQFAIHTLTMHSLGLGQQMPFTATLTNPIPKGFIETSGTFGPWQKDDPGSTALGGNYSFKRADLDTIKGISGILSSTGVFGGELGRIAVNGVTDTPDFQVDISGHPVALSTSFDALVDGTDGDTYLNTVHAQFLKTTLTAKGAVVGKKGVKGRTVSLNVHIQEGRIEDLLRLAVKGDKPLLVGRVGLRTDFLLPPGEPDVIERLELNGVFDVESARFTDREVQRKLAGMSHRARGRDPDDKAENVVSDLSGRFRLKKAVLTFSDLAFAMPGTIVRLKGSYGLKSEVLNFEGTVQIEATISEAVGSGGVKGFFLKLVDPIFRKKGKGAVIPIRVTGTRAHPKFGVDVGRVFKPG